MAQDKAETQKLRYPPQHPTQLRCAHAIATLRYAMRDHRGGDRESKGRTQPRLGPGEQKIGFSTGGALEAQASAGGPVP